MENVNVIGEGTYGCAHKPSLKCKNKTIDYTNKVSKILKKRHAATEMEEYDKISKIDKTNKFYLGKPTLCVPANDDFAKTAISLCANFKPNKIYKYNLLIMNDGGNNLEQYTRQIRMLPKTPENTEKIEKFWIEAQRILLGLTVFNANGIVHHDLKPQNIVYNEDTNRTNFIDFGLMTTMDNIRKESYASKYGYAQLHWSFPFEMAFMNKNDYIKLAKSTDKQQLPDELFKNKKVDTFFYYVLQNSKDTAKQQIYNDLNNALSKINENNYDMFIERLMHTIDVYGTGIAFMYILNKTKHLIDTKLENELRALFYQMITPDVFSRIFPDKLLLDYENILTQNGILSKYEKRFENHELVSNKPKTVVPKKHKLKIINLTPDAIEPKINRIMDTIDNMDTVPRKTCPEGKELNPLTRRCVNVCKYGYIRNSSFKCVRDKTVKLPKTQKTRKIKTPVNPKRLVILGL
jgi:serine/threonine protein kinase